MTGTWGTCGRTTNPGLRWDEALTQVTAVFLDRSSNIQNLTGSHKETPPLASVSTVFQDG